MFNAAGDELFRAPAGHPRWRRDRHAPGNFWQDQAQDAGALLNVAICLARRAGRCAWGLGFSRLVTLDIIASGIPLAGWNLWTLRGAAHTRTGVEKAWVQCARAG